MLTDVQNRLSIQDYEALPETNRIQELIDGALIVPGGPNIEHQIVVVRTYDFLKSLALGGVILLAPTGVHLDEQNVFEPDLLWLAPNSTFKLGERYVMGGADLVVEVLSASTARHDRVTKYRLYERFGIREYWIADPAHQLLDVFTLADGKYQTIGIYAPGDSFESPVLDGKSVVVAELFTPPAAD